MLSEQNMLWIAADALKAPLPVSWSAQKDSDGRTYFHNHLTNQSRWEHPLDPHFRKLRDKYRQSNAGLDGGGLVGGRSSLVLAGHAIRERSGSGSVNSSGFGGGTPPLPATGSHSSSSSTAANTNPLLPARPRPPAPTHLPEDSGTLAAAASARPKSALPERTEHQQLAYRSLQLVPTPQPQQQHRPPLQRKTAQPPPQQQHPPLRPGSAPAVAPSPHPTNSNPNPSSSGGGGKSSTSLVPANGVLYSMTLNKELTPFNPLATNNSFIPSLEVRSKLVTEAIYAPVPLFRPAPRQKQKAPVLSSSGSHRELDLSDWEAEASKGDLRFYVSSGGARSRPSSTPLVVTGNSSGARPSSSSRRTAQMMTTSGPSAVDRAVGLGRVALTHSHSTGAGLGLVGQKQRLASMFDGGLIDKLDSIIVAKSRSNSALTPAPTVQKIGKSRRDGKGGIVVL